MANPTMTLIASVTVGVAGSALIDFTSIPSAYTDLYIKLSGRLAGTGTGTQARFQFNGVTTGYSDKTVEGSGSAVSSISRTGSTYIYVTSSGSRRWWSVPLTSGEVQMYIFLITQEVQINQHQCSDFTENNGTAAYADLAAGLWSNTAVITSISITSQDASNFVQYTTAYLYGIKNN
jgi:hypothetical protein